MGSEMCIRDSLVIVVVLPDRVDLEPGRHEVELEAGSVVLGVEDDELGDNFMFVDSQGEPVSLMFNGEIGWRARIEADGTYVVTNENPVTVTENFLSPTFPFLFAIFLTPLGAMVVIFGALVFYIAKARAIKPPTNWSPAPPGGLSPPG